MQGSKKVFTVTLLTGAVLAVALLAVHGQTKPSAAMAGATAAPDRVAIDNFTFTPGDITVPAGTKITWVNHDDIPHTVVAAGKFKSGALDTNDDFSHTFDEPGTYEYFCSLHPKMTGKIVVVAKRK
jgi:plastocyanin